MEHHRPSMLHSTDEEKLDGKFEAGEEDQPTENDDETNKAKIGGHECASSALGRRSTACSSGNPSRLFVQLSDVRSWWLLSAWHFTCWVLERFLILG